MARTVDDKVVAMSFENSKFESGVRSTLSALDKLKHALDFKNAGKGLEGLNAAANRTNLSHIGRGIDELNSKFGALRVTGIAVMASIAGRAVSAGANMIKAFTFAPVIDGLHEYENQLNSVQTILANTSDQGTNLKQVNAALNQLNQYADKTIYNFGQMTKNVGTFTAAGVDLKTSVASIKGISNLAALSGSSAEQASTAMYQLSQAISAGRVGLQDWNSVVNAGMGGAVFQKSLMRTAENMGALKDGAVQIDKATGKATINGQSFRESIMSKPGEKSWLTGDVLTNTLKQLSGDMTDAQLKAEGFSDAQIKAIQSQSKMALDAATKVKTLSQLMDTTKEAIGSGWATTWQLVFGDFGEAKTLFTGLATAIGGFVKSSANARNSVLKDWKKLGGRTLLLDSLKNVFHALGRVLDTVRDSFRDIFPRKTGKDLFDLTKRFHDFTETLTPGRETLRKLHVTLRGVFAIFDIGKMIVGGIIGVIAKLFGVVGHGSGGFLDLTAAVGGWLFELDQSLKKGGKLNKFFDNLGNVLSVPIVLFHKLAEAIKSAFSGDALGNATDNLGPLQTIIDGITRAWDHFLGSVGSTREIVKPALEGVSQMFGGIGQTIADALKGADFDAVFKVLEVGLLGGIFLTLKKALSGGLGNALAGGVLKSIVQAFTGVGGLTRSISGTFGALTGSIQTMQQNVKSDTLKNIAISIALLSASIVGLSLVDPKRLNGALTAITIGFGQLLGAMAIMDKIGKSGGFIKMPVIAASMILLAGAIDLLSIAVIALGGQSWEQLAKGLGAVTVILGALSAASVPLSANAAGLIRAGLGITVIAVAMNILARAVKSFGGMDIPTLAKGIGGIAVALAGIGAASRLFPSGMVSIGVGLIAIGAGIKLLTGSVERLGNMDMRVLAKGIGAIAIALGAIGLAMRLMPGPSMAITAAGLVLVSLALQGISKAIQSMGGMSITQIAKGLVTMAASLAILTVALYAMSGTLAGSAALAVAAAGIALLAPALKELGDQSWTQIIKGLVSLAAAFALLGVAGLVLAPVAPAILALGAALIAVGAGLALAGAGVALLGIGLSAIAVAGPAAVKLLVSAMVQLTLALPKMIQGLVKALLQLVTSVADAAPKFVVAIGKIISAAALAVVAAAPALTKAFTAILQLVFKVLRDNFPDLVKTGFQMLLSLLKGIKDNIGKVVTTVVAIVGKFLGAITSNIGKFISAGASILLAILKGIGNIIGKVVTTVGTIIAKFVSAIGTNLGKIATAGLSILTKLLGAITNNLGKVLSMGTTIIVRLVRGIGNAASKIATAAISTVTNFIRTIASEMPKRADQVASSVIKMINAMAAVVRKREPEFIQALGKLGGAIVLGIVDGLNGLGKKMLAKIKDEITSLPGKGLKLVKKALTSVSLPLPDGLIRMFGVTLTGMTAGLVSEFESTFQKALVQIGGATNIEALHNLGNDLATSFKDGLLSGIDLPAIDPITQAGSDIVKQIAENQASIENTILESTQKIRAANAALDKDYEALRNARKIKDKSDRADKIKSIEEDIKQQKSIRTESGKTLAANEQLLNSLSQVSKFILLDPSYQEMINNLATAKNNVKILNDELEKQTGILDDLTAKRKTLFDQTFEKFSAMPGLVTEDAEGNPIDPATQVQNYINSLSNADDVVGVFTNSMDTLQGMGINADTYQQLLDIGPAAQGFVDALIKLGPGAIAGINAADSDLKNAASVLAEHGASEMYDTGIATAQGLINGLKVKIPAAIKAAEDIAIAIVKAIRHRLHIRSPSRVLMEIGELTTQGLAVGIESGTEGAVTAMNKVVAAVSEAASLNIDASPTITPVLDLTNIQNGSKTLASMLNVVPITAAASFGLASGISPEKNSPGGDTEEKAPIKFEQNNYSPEALSSIDIYRQTKNQLSQARPVLAS